MIYAIVGEERDLTLIVNALRGDLGRSVHACAPDESAETLSAAALEADFVTMSHDQVKTAIDANPDVSFHPIAVVGGTKKSRNAAADLREWCAPTRDGRTPRLNAQIGMIRLRQGVRRGRRRRDAPGGDGQPPQRHETHRPRRLRDADDDCLQRQGAALRDERPDRRRRHGPPHRQRPPAPPRARDCAHARRLRREAVNEHDWRR